MADNKFISRLKGTETTKSVVEVQNDKLIAPFTNVPHSTDVVGGIIDDKDTSIVVAKSAQNWKLNGSSLAVASTLSGDGADYTGEYNVSGAGLWVDAVYTFPTTGDPKHPVAEIFNASTKWVLKLCGKNLLSDAGDTIDFTLLVKIGSSNITTKTFKIAEGANAFCRKFVIDFSESEQQVIKAQGGANLTLQLLCADNTASATIYNGMTVLSALQRRVDASAVSASFANVEEALQDGILPSDYFDNTDFIDQVDDGEDAYAVFTRDGDNINLSGWTPKPEVARKEEIIVKSDTIPTASADLVGVVYQYTGVTTNPYEHGYIYECVETTPGVYGWERIDVQPGGSRGRFLSLWNCVTGLAESNPPISPYEYKTGDYFIISAISTATPAVNYKPNGSSYTTGVASTTVETNEVAVDDTYFFDGTTWKLQSNSNKTVTYGNIAGDIYDSASATTALNAKQATLVSGTNIKTINSTSLLGSGNIDVLVNEATATNALGVGYTTINTTYNDSINIGNASQVLANNAIALGAFASAEGQDSIAIYSSTGTSHRARTTHTGNIAIGYNALAINAPYTIAIGYNAFAQSTNAIQLGTGNNASSGTMQVWTHKLLDKTSGLIPAARFADQTSATQGQVLALDSSLDAQWTTLATVATSGSYNDLLNKPTLGTAAAADTTDFATAAQGAKADTALQTGDNVSELVNDAGYLVMGDLTNFVTKNTAQTISGLKTFSADIILSGTTSIKNTTSGVSYTMLYRDTSGIHVGTSTQALLLAGSGTRPTFNGNNVAMSADIPTVNNPTITITQGGVTKGSFTLNQASGDTIALTDTTYSVMTGATAGDAGTSGLVPAPAAGDQGKFLQGDGTWANPTAATAWGNITGTLSDQTDLQDALDAKANTGLDNLTSTGQNIGNWSSNVTNCITEIPQDIKLELNNGTLTLKAGSKVYMPNGVDTFDVITIASDLTIDGGSGSFSGSGTLYYHYTNSSLAWYASSVDASGTTPPSTSNFYNTSTNTVYRYSNGVQGAQLSFPLAHITVTNDVITSIDQVFNGFGYIGTAWFMLPNVKALVSNGLNADGTYKNIEFTNPSVYVYTPAASAKRTVGVIIDTSGNITDVLNGREDSVLSGTQLPTTVSGTNLFCYYKTDENQWYTTSGSTTANWTKFYPFYAGTRTDDGTTTSGFIIKPTFRADDSNLVHLAGAETITGIKTLGTSAYLIKKHGSKPDGTNHYSTIIEAHDVDGNIVGFYRNWFDTSKSIHTDIMAHRKISSTDYYSTVGAVVTSAGAMYGTAPASDVNGSIVTTVNKSKGSNGYFKLGNGLIIQWGHATGTGYNSQTTVNLPTAFSNTNYAVVGTCLNSGDNYGQGVYFRAAGTSSFTARTWRNAQDSASLGFRWIAVGY